MNHDTTPYSTSPTSASTIEQSVKSAAQDVREKATSTYESYEQKVRESPDKAILVALTAGYLMNVLPVGPLIALPLRLTAFLAKPALLALGALKACEIVQEQTSK